MNEIEWERTDTSMYLEYNVRGIPHGDRITISELVCQKHASGRFLVLKYPLKYFATLEEAKAEVLRRMVERRLARSDPQ